MQAVLGGKERGLMRKYASEMAVYAQGLGCISTPKDASKQFKYIQYTAGLEVRMRRLLRGKHGQTWLKLRVKGKQRHKTTNTRMHRGNPDMYDFTSFIYKLNISSKTLGKIDGTNNYES